MHKCKNTIGSYQCSCRAGYKSNGNDCDQIMLQKILNSSPSGARKGSEKELKEAVEDVVNQATDEIEKIEVLNVQELKPKFAILKKRINLSS